MPRYVLVAKFDHVADIKTLRDEDDKLSVTTTVLNAENENKEVAIDLSETSGSSFRCLFMASSAYVKF